MTVRRCPENDTPVLTEANVEQSAGIVHRSRFYLVDLDFE